MDVLGIKSKSEFEEWRQEKQDYLNGLTKEPEFETSAMDYHTQLVELYALEYVFYTSTLISLLMLP